ncbi:wax ester synthase/diacylglycerol acyltransferase 11-like [Aristolochia californica]|uniref:wax ester synthase/diacylglycerol acyltransferase 11-like n=1 Tax=Aristolochia californica TaxID=171875 RepID=UPI0035DB5AAE
MGSREGETVPRKGLKLLRMRKRNGGMANGSHGEQAGEEPLSPASRLFHEPSCNCYVIAIMGSAMKIDVDVLKAGLERTLLRHPRFSSIQEFSEGELGRWIPTEVVLDDHCVIPVVDPDMADPDQFVEDYVASLTKTSMDMSKPLWEFHAVNVKTSEAEAVAILRAHHSLGDGTSLISLLLACTRKTSDPHSLPTISVVKRPMIKGAGFLAFMATTWMLLRVALNTIMDVFLFLATYLFLKDTETVFKGAEGVEFHPKRIVHRTLELDDFKLIKSELDTTINDVMLGVISAGLSRYLSKTTFSEDGSTKEQRILPRNILVRAAVLVNIRPTPGLHVMATMMEKRSTGSQWGNWLGYVLLPFPMVIYEDPLDYVRKAKAIADRKKLSLESLFTFASSALLVSTLGIKAAAALSHRVLCNTTLSFSNLAGPAEELSFAGHPMTFLAPSVYGHPHALTVHFQSYMDKVKMVLAVDEEAIPDPRQLLEDAADSLRLIKDAVLSRR